MDYRIEKDTIGKVNVSNKALWGAQTQRSINNFKIGQSGSMPIEIIYGFAYLKKAAAYTNHKLGVLDIKKRDLISKVCDEILQGKHDNQFPLVIWQTGSGTQSNMNINEVISNRGHILQGNKLGDENDKLLTPNDDVNMSQSSNDTFPTWRWMLDQGHIGFISSEFILISLYNIQDQMEYPFDKEGLDDIDLDLFKLNRK